MTDQPRSLWKRITVAALAAVAASVLAGAAHLLVVYWATGSYRANLPADVLGRLRLQAIIDGAGNGLVLALGLIPLIVATVWWMSVRRKTPS